MIGRRAGSGRTISEGLKGFPWPLMPPEILKPRPGFFSILTHNWRRRKRTKQRRTGRKKGRKTGESEMHRSSRSLCEHRAGQTTRREMLQACAHVPCDMCWRAILEVQRFIHSFYGLFQIWLGAKPPGTREGEEKQTPAREISCSSWCE